MEIPPLIIGIDPGVHTGIAISRGGKLLDVYTTTITQSMVRITRGINTEFGDHIDMIHLNIEDAAARAWFGDSGKERWQGAGSIKRDCSIWRAFCDENKLSYSMIHPRSINKQLSEDAELFKKTTGWSGRTSIHARVAAQLALMRRPATRRA